MRVWRRVQLLHFAARCSSSRFTTTAFHQPQPNKYALEDAIVLCKQGKLSEALDVFERVDRHGVRPNSATYAYIVQRCASMKSLPIAERVHALIVRHGLEYDNFLGNQLVSMYGKCGSPDHARRIFDDMHEKDVVTWNMMMAAYASVGLAMEVCQLLQQMTVQRVEPDKITFINALNACASPSALHDGKLVHAYFVDNQITTDVAVGNALITMYAKCGSLENASSIFAKMLKRDVVSWTSIITAYTKHGRGKEALNLFRQMLREGINPDRVTFISVLDACASLGALEVGKLVHAKIDERGMGSDVVVGTALLNMYGKCGNLECAEMVFEKMQGQTVVSWNAMIAAYAQNGCGTKALNIFWQMQQDGVSPNKVTFVSMLNGFVSPTDLRESKLIHDLTVKGGVQSDVFVGTALVDMYGKCGSLEDAWRIFNKMIKRNVVSWTAMIAVYVQHGHEKEALLLFQQMQQECMKPNKITFITVLEACANLKLPDEGRLIHSQIVDCGIEFDAFLNTALVNMYGKCGKLGDAQRIYSGIAKQNVVTFTAMIAVYAEHGYGKEALQLFQQMQHEGTKLDEVTFTSILDAIASLVDTPEGKRVHALIIKKGLESDVGVGIALINMYGKCGTLDDTCYVFDMLPTQNVISINAMIAAFAQHEHGNDALALFRQMLQEGFKPDNITFISILDACTCPEDLVEGKVIHAYIIESGVESDTVVATAVISMYSRCGDLREAGRVFAAMPKRDIVGWNAMIAACSQHGCGKEVLKLFQQMQCENFQPNSRTFISTLSACSRAGLIDDGRWFFDSMGKVFGIAPTVEHYSCMVDLFGRGGLLNEAETFLNRMPLHPSPMAWLTLLSACKVHGDVDRAKRAAERVFELDPQNTGARMVLSNIYAVAGRWDDAANVIREIV